MKFFRNKFELLLKFLPGEITTRVSTAITILIFIAGVSLLAFLFSRSIDKSITDQKIHIVIDLVAKQAETHLMHIGVSSTLGLEGNPEADKIFKNLNDQLSESLHSISAMKLFTPEGKLIWSSLPGSKIGDFSDKKYILESISKGSFISTSEETLNPSLSSTNMLSLFVPIADMAGTPIAVIEVYFNTNDIATFTNNIGVSILLVGILSIILVYLVLRYTFSQQDSRLSSQARELSGIINMSPIGIYTIDRGGIIETYNPAMMRISGIKDANETIDKNVFDAEAYKSTGLAKLLAESTEGAPFETEVEIESSLADHKKTWRHYYGVPIKNSRGGVEHVLVMVQDVTEQKSLEKQVSEYSMNLEKKIAERTSELEVKLAELERFQKLTVDRELRMVELKKQIEDMRAKLESMGVKVATM